MVDLLARSELPLPLRLPLRPFIIYFLCKFLVLRLFHSSIIFTLTGPSSPVVNFNALTRIIPLAESTGTMAATMTELLTLVVILIV